MLRMFTDEECKEASGGSASPPATTSTLKRKKASVGATKKKPRIEIPMPSAPPSIEPQFTSLPDDFSFSLQPMSHLSKTVPHLSMGASSASALAISAPFPGPTVAQKRGVVDACDLVEKKRLHIEASQVNPLLFQLYMEKRMRVPTPVFFMADNPAQPLDQAIVCERIRQGFLDIPTLRSEYESKLLVQAGPMPLRDGTILQLPPCMFGNECFGTLEWTNIQGLTEPITLMQAMLPADFAILTRDRTQPSYKWPCVLCHRKMPTEAVQYFRHLDEVDKSRVLPVNTTRTFVCRENPDEIHQLWRNLENVEGGYYSERIFKANPREGVFAPLVENNVAALVATKQPSSGRWVINQNALIWRPPVMEKPHLGESLSNF